MNEDEEIAIDRHEAARWRRMDAAQDEIARLRLLVESAYEEGSVYGENARWDKSQSKLAMERKT